MFCDINFKRKNNTIEILDKRGEISSLYSKLVEYVQQNGVPQESMWYFDNLKEQGKITSDDPYELALGLYSIAFHSDKSENYWINKIQDLIPKSINNISYQLKSVDILLSDKAKQMFEKGKKNNWSLDKILSELAISKEQKTLIEGIQKDMSYYEDIPFNEQLAIELTNRYSYVIKINTAKFKESVFAEKDEDGYYTNGDFVERKEGENTNYYSNLTVPGGTNYTEQEISTPLITPSIKGHAQFSTDNGIGWFRSDDKQRVRGVGIYTKEQANKDLKEGKISEFEYEMASETFDIESPTETDTKTRRILELQSDLFQKGRDEYFLYEKEGKQTVLGTQIIDSSENQFLQLLNKNNNWVTFFVKSIIQDSVKKGYEKVLFPSGNTASKVEGHETLEDFIFQKYIRLEELETTKYGDTITDNNGRKYFKENDTFYEKGKFDSNKSWSNESIYKHEYEKFDNNRQIEINQLKQELERVETEGFGALRPIYNFYENTVTNILKKQGLNPVLITDEYGNTWNEVVLNNNFNPILLDKQTDRYTPSLLMYQDFIKKNQLYTGEEILPFIGESEYYRYLVPMLIKMNQNTNILFSDDLKKAIFIEMVRSKRSSKELRTLMQTDFNLAKGASLAILNTGFVKTDATTKTLVHELVHRTLQKEYDKKGDFHNQINELYKLADKYAFDNSIEAYGFQSPTEFLAESLSNPEFMAILNQIPYKEETIFSYLMRLVSDFINNLLNVELNSNSVLAEILRLTEQVIQNNVAEVSKNTNVEIGSLGQEIIDNWSSYFPEYDWMNDIQKQQTARLVESGKITLNCKF